MNLRDALKESAERHGVLTPSIVVADAEPEDSLLHTHFEWDDRVAGPKYRLVQARELIRSVRVSYVGDDGEPRDVRGFVSVQRGDPPDREYVAIEDLVDDPIATAIALREAEREWRALFSKYRHLSEFLNRVREDIAA